MMNAIFTFCRQGQLTAESQRLSRSLFTNDKIAATHVSADHKKVSTPDEGDIGRGTHEPAPVEEGDSSDVVPNLVTPDEESGYPLARTVCSAVTTC